MIKISVNANRSDIAGYISYYSCKEIAPLLEIEENEIIYETVNVDYFAFGDVDFSTKVETVVTISDNFIDHIGEINDILAKYLSGFVSEFDIRYEIINSNLIYSFKVASSHECHCSDDCGCKEGKECTCQDCHCDDECQCGDDCNCHHDHDCNCQENCECHHDEESGCNNHQCHCHKED